MMPTNRAKWCPPTGHRKNGYQQPIEQNNAHQQGTEKMVTNRAQKKGHQASKAKVPQQKLVVQYFLQQILDHASKIKVWHSTQILVGQKQVLWHWYVRLFPPRPEWIETNRLAIAGSFCGLRKTHWIPVYHFESWLYPWSLLQEYLYLKYIYISSVYPCK